MRMSRRFSWTPSPLYTHRVLLSLDLRSLLDPKAKAEDPGFGILYERASAGERLLVFHERLGQKEP